VSLLALTLENDIANSVAETAQSVMSLERSWATFLSRTLKRLAEYEFPRTKLSPSGNTMYVQGCHVDVWLMLTLIMQILSFKVGR